MTVLSFLSKVHWYQEWLGYQVNWHVLLAVCLSLLVVGLVSWGSFMLLTVYSSQFLAFLNSVTNLFVRFFVFGGLFLSVADNLSGWVLYFISWGIFILGVVVLVSFILALCLPIDLLRLLHAVKAWVNAHFPWLKVRKDEFMARHPFWGASGNTAFSVGKKLALAVPFIWANGLVSTWTWCVSHPYHLAVPLFMSLVWNGYVWYKSYKV